MYKWDDCVIPKVFKQLHKSQNRRRVGWQNVLYQISVTCAHLISKCLILSLLRQQRMQMLSTVMCVQLEYGIADLAVTVQYEHICMRMLTDTCKETIFLADNPVSMETSNYLTQKNNSQVVLRWHRVNSAFWHLCDYSTTVCCTSLKYTHCIWRTKKRLAWNTSPCIA